MIFDSARRRHEFVEGLVDISDQVLSHLFKALLYPQSPDVAHWKSEIYAMLRPFTIHQLKSGDKTRAVLDGLIEQPFDGITEHVYQVYYDDVVSEYGSPSKSVDLVSIQKSLKTIALYVGSSDSKGLKEFLSTLV